MRVTFTRVIERADDGGFGAYVVELPGCVAVADTEQEVKRLLDEAIEFHLELMAEFGYTVFAPGDSDSTQLIASRAAGVREATSSDPVFKLWDRRAVAC